MAVGAGLGAWGVINLMEGQQIWQQITNKIIRVIKLEKIDGYTVNFSEKDVK